MTQSALCLTKIGVLHQNKVITVSKIIGISSLREATMADLVSINTLYMAE